MKQALVLGLAASVSFAEERLVFRSWDPGHFPGRWGRSTVTLVSGDDGGTLKVVTEQPAPEFRRHSNAGGWATTSSEVFTQTFRSRRKRETTAWFEGDAGVLGLECQPGQVPVHAAGARILDVTCDCDGPCVKPRAWEPAETKPVTGLSCRVARPGEPRSATQPPLAPMPGVLLESEPLFFTAAPGVEAMRGKGDCPVRGYREAREPAPDWSVFPEGVTALREFEQRLAKKAPNSTTRVTKVVRTGSTLEVTRDEVTLWAGSVDESASAEGHTFSLSCWREARVVHSSDVRFRAGRKECEGHDEQASSRAGKPTRVLVCRPTIDGVVQDEPLVFVPGRTVERLDVDADCTRRRALRFIDSLAAPPFVTD